MSAPGLSVEQVAALLGEALPAALVASSYVTCVGSSGGAGDETVVFAEDAESLAKAAASRAGLILAGPGSRETVDAEQRARVWEMAQPRLAFARVARALRQIASEGQSGLDPAAVVHPSARLGQRVRIGAGAVVEAGAVLGDDVEIGSRAVISAGVVLGDRVVVQAGAVLGSRGFGYVRDRATGEYLLFPQQGDLVVEADVEIGANTTIDRGALEETRIGRGTKIDNLVHIGHNCRIGRNVVIAAQVGISGSCVIGDGAVLAGQVGISDHCEIGPGVILGGQAGVYRGKAVKGPGEVFAGTPAEPLKEQMRGLAQLRRLARPKRAKE